VSVLSHICMYILLACPAIMLSTLHLAYYYVGLTLSVQHLFCASNHSSITTSVIFHCKVMYICAIFHLAIMYQSVTCLCILQAVTYVGNRFK